MSFPPCNSMCPKILPLLLMILVSREFIQGTVAFLDTSRKLLSSSRPLFSDRHQHRIDRQRHDPRSKRHCSKPRPRCHSSKPMLLGKLSEADRERLLFSEVGLKAFVVAEMEHFVNQTMVEFDQQLRYGHKWVMPEHEKIQAGLVDAGTREIISQEYLDAVARFNGNGNTTIDGGALAVDLICSTTETAFQDGFRQQGLLSALGSAIIYFRNFYRSPSLIAACERVGLSDYDVAHHITDMYHHRTFRGAYTKTLQPSGKGEIAARIAIGEEDERERTCGSVSSNIQEGVAATEIDPHEGDECLIWSPTTPGLCLHWKSDNEAWRKTRFERIQMEGTKDPRRGGSGTTR